MSRCVAVALPVPVHRTFTYLWPEPAAPPQTGVRVRVPLGNRQLVGVVTSLDPPVEQPADKLRAVIQVLDPAPLLDSGLLRLAEFVAAYYVAPIGETLRTFLPSGLGAAGAVVGRRPMQRVAVLCERGDEVEAASHLLRRAPSQARALEILREERGRATLSRLAGLGVTARVIRALAERELVRIEEKPWKPSDPAELGLPGCEPALTLNADQSEAFESLREAIRTQSARQFLLFGVTGSGKTEVYLRAARAALESGRSVLILVPEIGLTPALIGRLARRFGEGLAVLHSRLSRTERLAHWHRIRSGEARIVVGARSAVFAPLPDPGLIVVDEEQDTSYKQEETPRYHARDMALVRGKRTGCPVLLVSATPSIESYSRGEAKRVDLLVLPRRVSGRQLPSFAIVDLREEFRRAGRTELVSDQLADALERNRGEGGQAILLLNRRGWASFLLCRACGEPIGCDHCSVSLVYHRAPPRLLCHYCGRTRPRPATCPACGENALQEMGSGTERIEEELSRLVTGLRVLRMDADTVRGRHGHLHVLKRFAAGEADVLLGTQMIAKGHDFPGVTLVGVLGGDSILSLPDFRAAEWTFQLVTQVAGRAGRGEHPGRVILQAFRADHYALQSAREHDFLGFYARESSFRRALLYPPHAVLAAVRAQHRDPERAARLIDRAAAVLLEDPEAGRFLRVLGPAPAPIARLRGRYRFHLLVKSRSRARLTAVLTRLRHVLEAEGVRARTVSLDVDPHTLL